MIVRLLKVLVFFILLGSLSYLGINRSLFLPTAKNIATSKETQQLNKQTEAEQVENQNLTSNESSSTEIVIKKEEIIPQKTTSTQKIKENTLTAYTPLKEEKSDSDPTYIPEISPCQATLGYKIGRLDPQFGISENEFIQEINMASSLWDNASQKKLFQYNKQGPLTINLIYDERQIRTENINNLTLEINNAKESAEAIRNVYEKEKSEYTLFVDSLKKDAEAFQEKYASYEAKVANYNAQGGATKSEYDQMMLELASLKSEGESLDQRRKEMLIRGDSINTKVAKYNEFAEYINTLIARSNALGAKKFTEGRFSPATMTIDIYQYNDTNKLRRVLAHELGHVLGINHNNNTRSIMYSVNSATTTVLSLEDIQSLRAVCK